jgi:hypothetical protein
MSTLSTTVSALKTGKQEPEAIPKLRKARFQDYSGIAALHDRHGFATKSHEEWISLWIHNPLYNQLADWPIGWVLEEKNQAIVGYLGNIPLPYVFRGRPIVAATSRAWIVDSSFRSYSFLLLSRFFQQRTVDLFINNTVNKNSVRGYEAFRACRVPVGAWDESIFWITNYRGFAASLLANKGIPAPKVLGYPLSLGLLAQDKLARRKLRVHQHGVSIAFANCFDTRFDRFWENLQCTNAGILLATRSREILEWHFRRSLAESRAWVIIAEEGRELAAYAIFLRRDNRKLGLNRLRLIDFQSLDNRNELFIPILSLALGRCRMEGVHMLEIIGLSLARQRILDAVVFHRRVLPSWSYFYKSNNDELTTALEDPRSWDPSCFDGDASL